MKKVFLLVLVLLLSMICFVGCATSETNAVQATLSGVDMSSLIVVVLLLAIVIVCVLLLQTKYKAQAAKILLYFVTQAESQFGGGTGQLKYAAVSAWLYEQLPALAQFLLPTKVIDQLIEEAVDNMKLYLESNVSAKVLIEGEAVKDA